MSKHDPYTKAESCEGKERLGKKHAQLAARTLSKRQLEPVRAYPCSWCGSWHVGHTGGFSPYRDGWLNRGRATRRRRR